MRLHREVLTGAERAADAGHGEADLLARQVQHARQLRLVDMQPLGRDVKVDAALAVGNRQPGLRSQRRLVLHPDLVLATHDDLGLCRRVAVAHVHAPRDVAVGM